MLSYELVQSLFADMFSAIRTENIQVDVVDKKPEIKLADCSVRTYEVVVRAMVNNELTISAAYAQVEIETTDYDQEEPDDPTMNHRVQIQYTTSAHVIANNIGADVLDPEEDGLVQHKITLDLTDMDLDVDQPEHICDIIKWHNIIPATIQALDFVDMDNVNEHLLAALEVC